MKQEELKEQEPGAVEGRGDYEFINEEVTPANRSIKRQHRLKVLGAVILVAVLFGVIARASYAVSDYFITVLLNDGGRSDVDLHASPTVPVSMGDQSEEPSINLEGGALEQYEQILQGVQNAAEVLGACLVDVSIVHLEKDPVFSGTNNVERSTCGVILADNNVEYLILVNYENNLAEPYDKITVTFDNGVAEEAELLNIHEELDMAILSVPHDKMTADDKEGISVVRIGDSSELRFGSVVLALGRPNGKNSSMDLGFVTMLNDTQYITDTSVDVMETNMTYQSHAEGILVNAQGELIGIISQKFAEGRSSLSALSINEISMMLQYMVNDLTPIGFGAVFYDLTDEMQEALDVSCGISLTKVQEESVAYEAGFRKGDIITKVGDEKIYYSSQFYTLINQYKRGSDIEITYFRGGREYTATIEATLDK